MPIFEYTCEKCGKDFEALLFGNDKPICDKCGSEKVIKKFSVFSTTPVAFFPA